MANSVKVYELSEKIPVDKDFNNHSLEVLLDGINDPGFYVLFISNQNHLLIRVNRVNRSFTKFYSLNLVHFQFYY